MDIHPRQVLVLLPVRVARKSRAGFYYFSVLEITGIDDSELLQMLHM